MARRLLLLGLLRANEMHGYQINELIDNHLGTSISLKKPTVYKLLGDMLKDGWIISREEQEGKYPTRRVYAITPSGEEAFQQLLRENLGSYNPASYLDNIGMVYLDAVPESEAVALLHKRRDAAVELRQKIQADENHHGSYQLILSYHLCHLDAELAWLDEVMADFKSTS